MISHSPEKQLDPLMSLPAHALQEIMRNVSAKKLWTLMISNRQFQAVGGSVLLERKGKSNYEAQKKLLRCWLACPNLMPKSFDNIDSFALYLEVYVTRPDVPHLNRTLAYACRLAHCLKYDNNVIACKDIMQRLMLSTLMTGIDFQIIMCVLAKHLENEAFYLSQKNHIVLSLTEELSYTKDYLTPINIALSFDVFKTFLPWLGPKVASKLIESLLSRCSNASTKDFSLYLLSCFSPHLAQKASPQLGKSLVEQLSLIGWFKKTANDVLQRIAPLFGDEAASSLVDEAMAWKKDYPKGSQSAAKTIFKYFVPRLSTGRFLIVVNRLIKSKYYNHLMIDVFPYSLVELYLDLKREIACQSIIPSTLFPDHSILLTSVTESTDELIKFSRYLFQQKRMLLIDKIIIPFVQTLDTVRAHNFIASLIDLKRKGNSKMRAGAVEILVSLVPHEDPQIEKEVVVTLLDALDDKDEMVCGAALKVLGKKISHLESKIGINFLSLLMKLMDHGDRTVRSEAIETSVLFVQQVGLEKASALIDILKGIFRSEGWLLSKNALSALVALSDQLNQKEIKSIVDLLLEKIALNSENEGRFYSLGALVKLAPLFERNMLEVIIVRLMLVRLCYKDLGDRAEHIISRLLFQLEFEKINRFINTLLDCVNYKYNDASKYLKKISEDLGLNFESQTSVGVVATLYAIMRDNSINNKEGVQECLYNRSCGLIAILLRTLDEILPSKSTNKYIHTLARIELIDTLLKLFRHDSYKDPHPIFRILFHLSQNLTPEEANELVSRLMKLNDDRYCSVLKLIVRICADRASHLGSEMVTVRLIPFFKERLGNNSEKVLITIIEIILPLSRELDLQIVNEFASILSRILGKDDLPSNTALLIIEIIVPLACKLGRIESDVFITPLLARLRRGNSKVRKIAINVITDLALRYGDEMDERIYSGLLISLRDPVTDVRDAASKAISHMLHRFGLVERFQRELPKRLKKALDVDQRVALLKIIAPPMTQQITQNTAGGFFEILQAMLEDESSKIRHVAIMGLIELAPNVKPETLLTLNDQLKERLKDISILVREGSANLLSYIFSTYHIEAVTNLVIRQPRLGYVIDEAMGFIFSFEDGRDGKDSKDREDELFRRVRIAYCSADTALLGKLDDDEIVVPAKTLLKIAPVDYLDHARIQRLRCRICFEEALHSLNKRKRYSKKNSQSYKLFSSNRIIELTSKLEEAKTFDESYLNHLIILTINGNAYHLDQGPLEQFKKSETVKTVLENTELMSHSIGNKNTPNFGKRKAE